MSIIGPRRSCRRMASHRTGRDLSGQPRCQLPWPPGNPVSTTTTTTSRVSRFAYTQTLQHPTANGPTVKRLWLLRHAKSSWDQPSLADPDRPLAPRRRRAADVLVAHLAAAEVRPTVVLCSSSLRTRQTLAAILPALGDALQIWMERAAAWGRSGSAAGPAPTGVEQRIVGHADRPQPGILRSKSSLFFLNPRCGVAVQNGVGMWCNGRSGST
jgi:hypothetical protein